jgi:hypothetical protein
MARFYKELQQSITIIMHRTKRRGRVGRAPVRIRQVPHSNLVQVNMTEDFSGFLQSVQTNSGK